MGNRKLLKWLGWGGVLLLCSPVLFTIYLAWNYGGSWLIYHKPRFQWQILDIETKQPIEGAVVAMYYQSSTPRLLDSPSSKTINVAEAVSDINGYVSVPEYTTIIQPLSFESSVVFTLYKPGYASIHCQTISVIISCNNNYNAIYTNRKRDNKEPITDCNDNILYLPRLTTKDERRRALVYEYEKTNNSILKEIIDEEHKYLFNY